MTPMDQYRNTAENSGVSGGVLYRWRTIKYGRTGKEKFSGKETKFCFEHMGLKEILWVFGKM